MAKKHKELYDYLKTLSKESLIKIIIKQEKSLDWNVVRADKLVKDINRLTTIR